MLQSIDLQRQSSSSELSVNSLELGNLTDERAHKRLVDWDSDLRNLLGETLNKPKFIGEIERNCSLNTALNSNTDPKDRIKLTQEGTIQETLTPNHNDIHQILGPDKPSLLDLTTKQPLKLSTNTPEEGLKLEIHTEENTKVNIKQKKLLFSSGLTSIKKLGLDTNHFNKTTKSHWNQNVIKLIHDKAFGPYGNEKIGNNKRNLKKSKPPHFIEIIKKHINRQTKSNRSSFRDILSKLRKMHLNPLQRLRRFVLAILTSIPQRIGGLCTYLLKHLLSPLNPDGIFLLIWEAIIIALVCVDLFLLPFTFAFEGHLREGSEIFDNIEMIQETLYILNIFINLHTSYYNKNGNLVTSQKKIFYHYIRGNIWIDLLSSYPYRWVQELAFENSNLIDGTFKTFDLLRFLRILRVFKVFSSNQILKRIEQHDLFNPVAMGLLSLIKLSLIITCLAHWCACCWYILGTSNTMNGWVMKANLDEDTGERYVASLYFAITTMLTVGYGDISPVSLRERIFAILMMLVGGGMFGYSMTSIAEIIKSLERKESKKK